MRALILGLALIIAESADQCPNDKFYDGWWEWAGIFETPKDENYKWIAQKVGGEYADPQMKLVVMSATTSTGLNLRSHQSEAMNTANTSCTDVQHEGVMTPSDTACYTLKFDDSRRETVFMVNAAGASNLIFFAEHVPTEFEDADADDGKHYLQDLNGTDVEPVAQLPDGTGHAHGDVHAAGIGNDPYLKNCVCQAAAFGWTLDCSKKGPVSAAAAYLEANEACASDDPPPTDECMKQYHIMQAHHDHCLHHDLPEDIEVVLHKYEKHYEDCIVKRQFDPDLKTCPEVTCTDEAALEAAVMDLNCGCETTCTAKCAAAMKVILMAHDNCPEEELPTSLEVALHDHEDVCAAHLCNSQASATFDPYDTACAAEASAAIGWGSQEAFLATTLALPLAVFFSS